MRRNTRWLKSFLPRWVRPIAPFLLLPGLVLVGLSIVLGPRIWEAVYASYQFCQMYLMHASPGDIVLSLTAILGGVAIAGGAIGGTRELRRLRQLSKALAQAGGTTEKVILGRPVVLVQDHVPFAFCHGLLRPRVYLSAALVCLLDPGELDAVLRHEEVHARRRDPLRVFAVRVLAAALFFLPLARVARERHLVWLEIQADHEVVRHVGRQPLAGALVKLLEATPQPALMYAAAVSRFNPTEERVRRLLEPAPQPRLPVVPGQVLLANAVLVINTGLLAPTAVYGANWLLMGPFVCPVPVA